MTLWADPGLYFFKSNIQNLVTPLAPADAELIEVSGKNKLVEILLEPPGCSPARRGAKHSLKKAI